MSKRLSGLSVLGIVLTWGCASTRGSNELAKTSDLTQERFLVPRIAEGGVDKVPEVKDESGLETDIERPALACGAEGKIAERVADCLKRNPETALVQLPGQPQDASWSLVVRAEDGSEVWRDNQTKLVWSDRIGWIDRQRFNWCQASGSNNKVDSPLAESDPFFWCNTQSFQSQFAPVSLCAEDSQHLNGTKDSDPSKGGLGVLPGATTAFAWRLPSITDFQNAFVNGAGKVFPRLNLSPNPPAAGLHDRVFWTSSVFSFNRRKAWVFHFGLGEGDFNWRSAESHAVRCVGSESSL